MSWLASLLAITFTFMTLVGEGVERPPAQTKPSTQSTKPPAKAKTPPATEKEPAEELDPEGDWDYPPAPPRSGK